MFTELENLFTTISGLSTIATLVTSVVALFTLKEMSKQRKSAYKPEIVLSSVNYVQVISKGKHYTNFEIVHTYNKDNNEQMSELHKQNIKIKLFNIGKGAAKDVKLHWSYDIDLLLSKIDQEVADVEQIRNLLIYSELGGGRGGINLEHEQLQKLDYVLPTENKENDIYCIVPKSFSFCSYLAALSYIRRAEYEHPEFKNPQIELEIEYSDIGQQKHRKKYLGDWKFYIWEVDTNERKAKLECQLNFLPVV